MRGSGKGCSPGASSLQSFVSGTVPNNSQKVLKNRSNVLEKYQSDGTTLFSTTIMKDSIMKLEDQLCCWVLRKRVPKEASNKNYSSEPSE